MAPIPSISESEWKIMKVLWARSPLPAYDIIQALAAEHWHPNTVKTLLARLGRKRALAVRRYKNLHLYSPLITEQECADAASESFLERVFGGSLKPMLAHFVQHRKLSKRQIDELKRILDGEEA